MHGIPRNATYRSKTTQNDIITICGELITEQILNEVKEAKFFAILADEDTDRSSVEQMSLVIRYIYRNCSIREEFIGFITLDRGLPGLMITNKLLHTIQGHGLSVIMSWAGL